MANFTTEQDVRDKFQLTDTTVFPSALIASNIDDAHTELLRALDPEYDTGSPPDALVLGETFLAGAHVLRALASKTATELKHLSIGGKRIQPGERFPALNATADAAEEEAWKHMAPYLLASPPMSPLRATETVPVLGSE